MKSLKVLKLVLGGIFLALLFYNLYVGVGLKYETDGDAWDYVHLGLSIAKVGKYGHFNASREQLLADFKEDLVKKKNYTFSKQTAFRPPIWPFLIAVIFFVFGYSLTQLIIFKILLHLLGAFIFYKSLKLLNLKEIIVVTGTFLYGVSPAWQLYSRVFLSEPITLFFITLWIYLLILYLKNRISFVPQAIIGGILILSHPYYLFFPFSVWLILLIKKQLNFKIFVLSSIIGASIVSVWIIRNFIVLDTDQVVLTTSSGAVMAKGWNKKVPTAHTNTKGDLADETLVLESYKLETQVGGEVEKMQLYKNATLHFIISNPDMILPIVSRKLLSSFNPFPETPRPGFLETGRWIYQFLALLALLYILIFTRSKLLRSLAIGLILSTIGITILTYSGFRFRMPQVGLEVLLIAYVANDLVKAFLEMKNHKES